MEIFLFYLLRVTIAATILYLFFKFILSKRTFHAINRMVVLSIVVMTLVLPLFTVTLPEISFLQPKVETATTQLTIEEALAYLNAASYTNTPAVTPTPATEIPWLKILGVIYFIGFAVALLRFAISFIRMSRIIRQTKKIRLDDNSLLCISDKKVSPFSWMKFIVLSKEDLEAENQDIIRHEQAHVAFGHSYDLLFLDVYSLVFWFNPFAWLLRLELQTIHEYQADEKVLAEGANAQNYHLSLIRQCVGEYKFALANNFEYNNLHKRIKMTMKTKSSSRQKWLYGTIGLSIMLCIVVLSFNGLKAKAADLKEMIESGISEATGNMPADSAKTVKQTSINTTQTNEKKNEKILIEGYGTQLQNDLQDLNNQTKLRFRNQSGENPLIFLDGKEVPQSVLESLNLDYIDHVEVLKDASATKIYGNKGKDGVIMVTTRKNAVNRQVDESKFVIGGPGDTEESRLKSAPALVIDGVLQPNTHNTNIKPENIETVSTIKRNEVEKRKTELIQKYGQQAINGVIFITTKKNASNPANDKILIRKAETKSTETDDKDQTRKNEEIQYGHTTWNGLTPLIIIDGIESSQGINSVDIQDISNISVLKDASATKIYGDKGKNGVILIITKEYAAIPESQKILMRNTATKSTEANKNQEIQYDAYETIKKVLKNADKEIKIKVPPSSIFDQASGLKPLMIIVGEESTKNIDPNSIDNIVVMKGARFNEQYGDKAKNGVIQVTTKKNAASSTLKQGQVKINEGYGVLSQPSIDIKLSDILPQPLYLVDGKEAPANFMQNVSGDDIESIMVLKDTAVTSVYGKKGKNGVILIKMKKK